MSKVVPTEMDNFLPLISTTDTKMRLSVGAKLLLFVLNPSNSIVCSDIGLLIDHLINWLQSSNHKIVQNALDVLGELINRMRYDFQPYLTSLLPHLVDKLEDNKEIIREKTSCLFLKLVDCEVIGLQNLFDKISVSCFNHKNSNVREQIMYLLCTVLDNYGTSTITISKFVPNIVKLLSDSNASVRSTAFDTLCKIYKHVGERLRVDLLKKNLIPSNKLQPLMNKFDEIKSSDDGLTNAFQSLKLCNDEVDLRDNRIDGNSLKRPNSRPPVTPASLSLACSAKKKIMSASVSASKMNMNSQSEKKRHYNKI